MSGQPGLAVAAFRRAATALASPPSHAFPRVEEDLDEFVEEDDLASPASHAFHLPTGTLTPANQLF